VTSTFPGVFGRLKFLNFKFVIITKLEVRLTEGLTPSVILIAPLYKSKTVGSFPIWSPDGNRIAFAGGTTLDTLYEKSASGAGEERELLKKPGEVLVPSSWSRDGRFLLFYTNNASSTLADVWVLPLEGDRKPLQLLGTPFSEQQARFSPDMRWIAYASTESGRSEIYVRPFVAAGPSGPALG
jgi:Tol biopolymer transport system component